MKSIAHHLNQAITNSHTFAKSLKLKKHHHYFLLALVSLSIGFFAYNEKVVHAATFDFTQSSWTGGANTSATTSSQTGWNKYYSSDGLVVGSTLTTTYSSYSFTDDGTQSFPMEIYNNAITRLNDGRLVSTGGITAAGTVQTVTYIGTISGNSITWVSSNALPAARQGHSASTLADGRILVVGGYNGGATNTTYFGTVSGNTITWVAGTAFPRVAGAYYHDASILSDGRILITGGIDATTYLGTISGNTITWVQSTSFSIAMYDHTASVLSDGRILILGGTNTSTSTYLGTVSGNSITWTASTALPPGARGHTASVLSDGRVLILGANTTTGKSTYLGTVSGNSITWTASTDLPYGIWFHNANTLLDGSVLLTTGVGYGAYTAATSTSYVFMVSGNTLTRAGFEMGTNSNTMITATGTASSIGLANGTLSTKTDYTTGTGPRAVTISPDGAYVYVANGSTINAFPRSTSTGALSAKTDYTNGVVAQEITISPDGTSVYVVNSSANTISLFPRSTSTGALSAKTDYTASTSPYSIAISPDGTSVYVANLNSNTVSLFPRSTSTGVLSANTNYTTGSGPTSITISPDGAYVYVANYTSNSISRFPRNTSTGALSAKTDYIITGSNPYSIAISPDGTSVYTANYTPNSISLFPRSTSTGSLSAKTDYTTGSGPYYIAISPDGTSVYTANLGANTVSMFTRNKPSSGTFTSAVIDTGSITSFTTLGYTTTLNGQTISVDIRAGNTASSTDGTWTSWITGVADSGNISSLSGNRYIQYKVTASTNDTSVSPTLDSLTINNTRFIESGNLISSIYDTLDANSVISNISWTETSTSTNNFVKFQIRASTTEALVSSSTWCGPTSCNGTDYFTVNNGVTGGISTSSPLRAVSSRYLQYKTIFVSNGSGASNISNVSVQYVSNASPNFDTSYGTNGVSVIQNATPLDSNLGKTQISYSIRDIDTNSGSATANYLTPIFEYSLNNGSSWAPVSTSTLTTGDAPTNGGYSTYNSSTTNKVLTSGYLTYTVFWDAGAQIGTNTEISDAKIRITLNDNEGANNSTSTISSAFTLDTKAPTGTITFDAGVTGVANGATVYIKPIDATSSAEYLITDDSSNSTPLSTGWVATSSNATTTIFWTFDSDNEAKTLKFQFKDAYGNTSSTSTVITSTPIPSDSFIVQDTSSILSNPKIYRMYIGWQTSTSTSFASYKLEYATSTDNDIYGNYSNVTEITNSSTAYYVHTDLNTALFYRYRLAVRDTNGNVSLRSNAYTTARPDGVQNYGEGGGGTSMTAPVVKNTIPTQNADGNVTIAYNLTDLNENVKSSPSYEGYIFYNNGVTVTASSTSITVSDASKMLDSGYIQIKNEVIKYTSKSGNVLSGLTRGTWPTAGSGRETLTNSEFYIGTPVWIMASSTSPISITDTSILSGQNGTTTWDVTKETSLAGYSYNNVNVRMLIHDNQSSASGPLSTQNSATDDGILTTLDMTVPTLNFISTSAQGNQATASTSESFKVFLSKPYALDTTLTYTLSGTAENGGVDYTMATGTTVTILSGATTTNIFAEITSTTTANISEGNKTIIVTLASPTNASIGTDNVSTYTIINSNIHAPEFAPIGGVVINQITEGADIGKILISYAVKDQDAFSTVNGDSSTITPSFKYSTDNGTTWTTINNLSSGSLDSKSVSDIGYTATSTTFSTGANSTTALWDVASQLTDTYAGDLKVQVTATAGTVRPSSTATSSNSIVLDAKHPVVTLGLNINTGTTSLDITDNSNISYIISNNSDLTADGVNAISGIWQDTGSTAVSTSGAWTFSTSTNPTIYYSVKDTLNNSATSSNAGPATITGVQLRDTSSSVTSTYGEVLSWNVYTATSTASFSKYKVYRSATDESSYALLSEITNANQNSYVDNTVASTSPYYYKVLVVDSDGDISAYSSSVTDTPDGQSPDNVAPIITNASSTTPTSNAVTITWTTNEYASSSIEYSDSQGIFNTIASDSSFVTDHSITLSNLVSGTTYYYQIKSTDIVGNTVTDNNGGSGYNFSTRGGPRITNVLTTQPTITDTTASIFWNTNILSDSQVYYSTDILTVNSATSSVYVSDSTATTTHQINLTGLSPATTYYFKVVSASAEDNTLTSTDDNKSTSYPYASQYYSVTTLDDNAAPTITNVSASYLATDFAVITWTTSENATSRVYWGTASTALASSTALDSLKVTNHNVTINNLTQATTYYFAVESTDATNHTTTSTTTTFTTTSNGQIILINPGDGSGTNTKAPVIISTTVDSTTLGAFNADIKVEASKDVRAFITYGETTTYGQTEGDNALSSTKTIKLNRLKTGTTYHYRVQVIDKAGNDVSSADLTFKTKFLSEVTDTRTLLDKSLDLQGQIDLLIESALPSLSPPFVSKPEISNITENSATITWKTNIKTLGTLSYATEQDFLVKNEYVQDISTGLDKLASHSVDLVNLQPNTNYHIQARSYVFPQVMGKSEDVIFNTQSPKVLANIVEVKKDSFIVVWKTELPTTSIIEYKNTRTGEINRVTDQTMNTLHSVKIENVPSATSYTVKVSGMSEKGNLIEAGETLSVTTSSDNTPPVVSNFKVDNALVPGRNDRIQTVVGWQTDEAANATVYYEEGVGIAGDTKELSSKVESLDSYTNNHIMIIANLKPGTIYRLKVVSTDSSGNTTTFGPRTIITPRQTESVLDIIFKNFEDTFKFLRQ